MTCALEHLGSHQETASVSRIENRVSGYTAKFFPGSVAAESDSFQPELSLEVIFHWQCPYRNFQECLISIFHEFPDLFHSKFLRRGLHRSAQIRIPSEDGDTKTALPKCCDDRCRRWRTVEQVQPEAVVDTESSQCGAEFADFHWRR